MYAVVETGGKQYKTATGESLQVETLRVQAGKKVKLDKVLLVADKAKRWVGKPYVKGAYVEAEVVKHQRSPKVISFKYIRREGNSQRKVGHRQNLTQIKVLSIQKP